MSLGPITRDTTVPPSKSATEKQGNVSLVTETTRSQIAPPMITKATETRTAIPVMTQATEAQAAFSVTPRMTETQSGVSVITQTTQIQTPDLVIKQEAEERTTASVIRQAIDTRTSVPGMMRETDAHLVLPVISPTILKQNPVTITVQVKEPEMVTQATKKKSIAPAPIQVTDSQTGVPVLTKSPEIQTAVCMSSKATDTQKFNKEHTRNSVKCQQLQSEVGSRFR